MSVRECHKYLKKGYKFGFDGYCHLYDEGDEKSRIAALKKAMNDGHELQRTHRQVISILGINL